MEFKLPLIAVKDIERSKAFYMSIFKQTIEFDFGRNVTFHGGFAIQEDFAELLGLESETVMTRSHNMELYFEVDDFDGFMDRISEFEGIRFVHDPKTYEWHQRVVRLYDPDGHIIEIGEAMTAIAKRFLQQGYDAQTVADMIQHPLSFVENLED